MEKVSHHYVPQFYLRYFSANSKSVGLFIIEKNKYIKEASIKKQACKDHLYGEDDSIENMFMELESHASVCIRRIIETRRIPDRTSPDYEILLFFILMSEGRNLKSADSANNLTDVLMKQIMKMDKSHNFSREEIEEITLSMDIPNLMTLQATAKSYQVLFDLKCVLIVNKTDRQFITSDNPLVRYNQMYVLRNYRLRGYGLGTMGLQLFFPISPKLCICIFDDVMYEYEKNNEGNIEVAKSKHIDEINRLIYLNSYKNLFFNNSVKESYMYKIVGSSKHTTAEIHKEVTIWGPEGAEQLIAISPRQVSERINLPMFRINRNLLKMPLPAHMGGPIRPYAERFMQDDEDEDEE